MKRSPSPTSTAEPALKRTALSTVESLVPSASSTMSFRLQKLSPLATIPTRGSALAAGYDLYSAEDKVVPAQGKALISTGIAMAVPEGTYGRVAPRSGLASKHMIDTGAGVIDADYRGEVKVLLFNHAKEDFAVKTNDRIAQLILERIVTPEALEVESLDDTARGAGGFGSTGGFGAAVAQAADAVKDGAVSAAQVAQQKAGEAAQAVQEFAAKQ
ncbi:hypothetical protein JCM8547_008570 [Rhodosporidiobolus lusitaniae]